MTQDGPTSVKSDRVGAVRRLANRSFRHKVGRFLVEGPQAVREAVRWRPGAIDEVFLADDAASPARQVADEAAAGGLRVTTVPEPVLLAMTETVHPQGIAAVCAFLDDRDPGELLEGARLVAVLHEIRDPGNAGTILRTADAAGADAVLFSGDAVDPYNGKCVRSTAGSLFHIPFARIAGLPEVASIVAAAGIQLLATDGDGPESLPDLRNSGDLSRPTAWIFGNEAHGLPDSAPSDRRVAIPIYGNAESLNLAAAAGVALYTTAISQNET